MSFQIKEIATKPFDGQKPGTSGLRKRLVVANTEEFLLIQVPESKYSSRR